MPLRYNAMDWYWIVAGDETALWSSAKAAYVAPDDTDYLAWKEAGGIATPIASVTDLLAVLHEQWQPLYFNINHIEFYSAATPPLSDTYPLTDAGRQKLAAVNSGYGSTKLFPGGAEGQQTFTYYGITGIAHSFDRKSFFSMTVLTENYVYDFENALVALLNKVAGAALPSNRFDLDALTITDYFAKTD